MSRPGAPIAIMLELDDSERRAEAGAGLRPATHICFVERLDDAVQPARRTAKLEDLPGPGLAADILSGRADKQVSAVVEIVERGPPDRDRCAEARAGL